MSSDNYQMLDLGNGLAVHLGDRIRFTAVNGIFEESHACMTLSEETSKKLMLLKDENPEIFRLSCFQAAYQMLVATKMQSLAINCLTSGSADEKGRGYKLIETIAESIKTLVEQCTEVAPGDNEELQRFVRLLEGV